MMPNPLFGATLLSLGGCSSALCYTPQKKVRLWSWQTYWLAQAFVCWLILPCLCAWLTTPELFAVLAAAPLKTVLTTTLLGALFGIGGTAFGEAIRYIGFSLTYALAIGISCVAGTLFTPVVSGQLASLLAKRGAHWVLAGVAVAAVGILVSGLAGWLKDRDLCHAGANANIEPADLLGPADFQFVKGLFFCVLAGLLSAVFGISLDVGRPIAALAAAHGAGQFEGNVVYTFSCGGAFLTTLVYCLVLHFRHRTLSEYTRLSDNAHSFTLSFNFSLAALTGLLWYAQFFLYGLGQVRMGAYKFTSWAITNAMIVFFGTIAGLVMREWKGCRLRTWLTLSASIFLLLLAVGFMTYGNYLGSG